MTLTNFLFFFLRLLIVFNLEDCFQFFLFSSISSSTLTCFHHLSGFIFPEGLLINPSFFMLTPLFPFHCFRWGDLCWIGFNCVLFDLLGEIWGDPIVYVPALEHLSPSPTSGCCSCNFRGLRFGSDLTYQ